MSSLPPESKERNQQASPDKKGVPTFDWTLTHTSILDTVKLILPATNTVPIIFVPGIMGSNLQSNGGDPVWRLDGYISVPMGGPGGSGILEIPTGDNPGNLAARWILEKAGARQKALHPARCKVDPRGATPRQRVGTITKLTDYVERGWGEVSQTSYQSFLLWLEERMNPATSNPLLWENFEDHNTYVNATLKPGEVRPTPKLRPGLIMSMPGLPGTTDAGKFSVQVSSDDLLARTKHRFPVYACGYNWLDTNLTAADFLAARITKAIKENNNGYYTCSQVILVTHSMGGLVARACSELKGKKGSIVGIVHGVMPAVGAAVAYRRCKVGMGDEGDAIPARVIGRTGREITAVFAQAPGALQLLPSDDYPKGWLKFSPESMRVTASVHNKPHAGFDGTPLEMEEILVVGSLPYKKSAYESIYLRKDRWWGLVREEWLKPVGGIEFSWDDFEKCIGKARDFHSKGDLGISGKYHPNTYVYYGNGDGKQASFECITWEIKPGRQPDVDSAPVPTAAAAINYSPNQTRTDGSNAIYIGGETQFNPAYLISPILFSPTREVSYWELRCSKQDGTGDGTVPRSSGSAPFRVAEGAIQQQFGLAGFDHEGSYKNSVAQVVTLYSITKIAVAAKLPA